jgi:hypothetical protein
VALEDKLAMQDDASQENKNQLALAAAKESSLERRKRELEHEVDQLRLELKAAHQAIADKRKQDVVQVRARRL